MAKFLTDLRSSLWFIPAVLVLLAAVLAILAVELDRWLGMDALARYPKLFGVGAEGARQLLSAIAGSTITVAGVVFSITIVALSLAAAQYSPRVLRNFMRDRANQLVLGAFVGIYVYCLLVLRTIRGGEDAFIPGLSILVAIALALAGIGFLIFFIHHVASSIQVTEIASHIADETIEALRASAARSAGERCEDELSARSRSLEWHAVPAPASGYLQRVNENELVACARKCRRAVRMERAVGDFVVLGKPLLSISGSEEPPASVIAALNAACAINTYRDITQDPIYGVHQLVDIALKALSPGVNDTGTARNTFDYLMTILSEMAERSTAESCYVVDEGELRLVRRVRTVEDYIDDALGPIRRVSVNNLDMIFHVLRALAELARATPASTFRAALITHITAIGEAAERMDVASTDKTTLSKLVGQAHESASTGGSFVS